jgi:hypothetical protein
VQLEVTMRTLGASQVSRDSALILMTTFRNHLLVFYKHFAAEKWLHSEVGEGRGEISDK